MSAASPCSVDSDASPCAIEADMESKSACDAARKLATAEAAFCDGNFQACIRLTMNAMRSHPTDEAISLLRRARAEVMIPPLRGPDGELCQSPVVRRHRSKHFPSSPHVAQRRDSTRTSWPLNRRRSHEFSCGEEERSEDRNVCNKRLRRSDEGPGVFEINMLKGALEDIDTEVGGNHSAPFGAPCGDAAFLRRSSTDPGPAPAVERAAMEMRAARRASGDPRAQKSSVPPRATQLAVQHQAPIARTSSMPCEAISMVEYSPARSLKHSPLIDQSSGRQPDSAGRRRMEEDSCAHGLPPRAKHAPGSAGGHAPSLGARERQQTTPGGPVIGGACFATPTREQLDLNMLTSAEMIEVRPQVDALVRCGVRIVAIDFDMTLIRKHTKGQWPGSAEKLRRCVRPVFLRLIPALIQRGLVVAIVSFSPQVDLIRRLLTLTYPEAKLGEHLFVRGAVKESPDKENRCEGIVVRKRPVRRSRRSSSETDIANAQAWSPRSTGKRPHIESVIRRHAEAHRLHKPVHLREVLLIDDDEENISIARDDGVWSLFFRATEPDLAVKLMLQEWTAMFADR